MSQISQNSKDNIIYLIYKSDIHQADRTLKDLLIQIGTRGFMTALGFRKTTGSQDMPWPLRSVLLDNFNKPHTVLSKSNALLKFFR